MDEYREAQEYSRQRDEEILSLVAKLMKDHPHDRLLFVLRRIWSDSYFGFPGQSRIFSVVKGEEIMDIRVSNNFEIHNVTVDADNESPNEKLPKGTLEYDKQSNSWKSIYELDLWGGWQ